MRNALGNSILFLQVKGQDQEAYGRFYDLYVKRIYRFVYFKVNSTTDAQDLTSEVFLKIWQYIKEGKDIKNLNAFTYMIARNLVIDFYRSKSREDQSLENTNTLDQVDQSKDLLKEQIKDSDLRGVLSGLDHLKDEYKEVIILKYLDELSTKEIAEIVGKTNGAVRVLLHRAIEALKKNIKTDEE
jgi:RNA polymerase sigma-70 factor, ECF subfamily